MNFQYCGSHQLYFLISHILLSDKNNLEISNNDTANYTVKAHLMGAQAGDHHSSIADCNSLMTDRND